MHRLVIRKPVLKSFKVVIYNRREINLSGSLSANVNMLGFILV